RRRHGRRRAARGLLGGAAARRCRRSGGRLRRRSAGHRAAMGAGEARYRMTSTDTEAVTVRFHRTLYTEAAITEAAETFSGLASFAVHSDGEHHVVEVSAI